MRTVQLAFVIWSRVTYLFCCLVLSSITESDSVNSLTTFDIIIALGLTEHPLAIEEKHTELPCSPPAYFLWLCCLNQCDLNCHLIFEIPGLCLHITARILYLKCKSCSVTCGLRAIHSLTYLVHVICAQWLGWRGVHSRHGCWACRNEKRYLVSSGSSQSGKTDITSTAVEHEQEQVPPLPPRCKSAVLLHRTQLTRAVSISPGFLLASCGSTSLE